MGAPRKGGTSPKERRKNRERSFFLVGKKEPKKELARR
jgi:hypothetical protein